MTRLLAIPAVSIMEMAGTGKTFLALAAALEQTVEAQRYRRVAVYRPLVAVGQRRRGSISRQRVGECQRRGR